MTQKKPIRWNPEKNLELMQERGVSFEEILSSIEQGGLLMTLDHPNQRKYHIHPTVSEYLPTLLQDLRPLN